MFRLIYDGLITFSPSFLSSETEWPNPDGKNIYLGSKSVKLVLMTDFLTEIVWLLKNFQFLFCFRLNIF